MTTQITTWSAEMADTIKKTVAKGATDAEFEMFSRLAIKYGLDPFAKEIWCVSMGGGGVTIMASRDGYLKAAQRDPDYRGLKSFVVREGDDFEIDAMSCSVRHKFGLKRGAILGAWAMATHALREPVIVWAEFGEYNKSNGTWRQYPSAMIQKVAEVMALKRQFGINGLVSQEEIGTAEEGSRPSSTPARQITEPITQVIAPAPALTPAQIKRMFAIAKSHGVDNEALKALMIAEFDVDRSADLTRAQYDELCDKILPSLLQVEEVIDEAR
jgi:phage recombination protein Bet